MTNNLPSQLTDAEVLTIQNLANLNLKKGDMLYFDGKDLCVLPAGKEKQTLTIVKGIPTWV